jgi:hypothetical protein
MATDCPENAGWSPVRRVGGDYAQKSRGKDGYGREDKEK